MPMIKQKKKKATVTNCCKDRFAVCLAGKLTAPHTKGHQMNVLALLFVAIAIGQMQLRFAVAV